MASYLIKLILISIVFVIKKKANYIDALEAAKQTRAVPSWFKSETILLVYLPVLQKYW